MNEKTIKNFDTRKINRDKSEKSSEPVAVEKSYDLLLNGMRVTSLMASPSELRELGYGYLVTEGIVKSKSQILSVKVMENEIYAFVKGAENIRNSLELRSSGCVGVNWDKKEEKEQASVESDLSIPSQTIFQTLRELRSNVYAQTSGSHSAVLLDREGTVLAKTVDVGRHNIYDKIVGKALMEDIDLSKTMLLSTGRQSAGMVMKAARSGIPIVVTKAAPLSSGIKAAQRTGITLICFLDEEKMKIFSHSKRIKFSSSSKREKTENSGKRNE